MATNRDITVADVESLLEWGFNDMGLTDDEIATIKTALYLALPLVKQIESARSRDLKGERAGAVEAAQMAQVFRTLPVELL